MTGLLVHEWIEAHGGSENVFEAMAEAFPGAGIHCLWNDAPHRFSDRAVTESWMARTPLRRNKAAALPFMPATWARKNVSQYDFVLVSSHLFAHHVGGKVAADGPQKFVYVHTPARYIWTPDLDRRGSNVLVRAVSPLIQALDRGRAAQGARFAANSEFVRARIRNAWDQDAEVIYPPVRVEHIQSVPDWRDVLEAADASVIEGLPGNFILAASRFVSYKRLDLAIRAGEAAGMPVVIAGSGPQYAELAALAAVASVPVRFVLSPSNELLYALYQAATVFAFMAVEDFGIMPVEAMCLGTPVLVSHIGGAAESVGALRGGVALESLSRRSLADGVSGAASLNMEYARKQANAAFGQSAFSERLHEWMAPRAAPFVASDGATERVAILDRQERPHLQPSDQNGNT